MYVYRGNSKESFSPKTKEEFEVQQTTPTPNPTPEKCDTNWTTILSIFLLICVLITIIYISMRR